MTLNGKKKLTLQEAAEIFKAKFPSVRFDAWETDEGEFQFVVKLGPNQLQYLMTEAREVHDISEY